MKIEENEKYEKYSCIKCNYTCSYMSDWVRHTSTRKHNVSNNGNILEVNGKNNFDEKIEKIEKNINCKYCDKSYKTLSGLWKHSKKCIEEQNNPSAISVEICDKEISDKELIMMLVKQNSELLEVLKNGTHVTNSNNNTNSNNKTFNLQFFLNETCKDAMNIMDFVDSIKLQLSDLENVGKIGYVEGISNIITSNLKALDVTQRPIHCTDKKRETLYIKDENKWEKEDDQKKKLRKAIRRVATKNQMLVPKFKEVHPDCAKANSKYSDQYIKIIVESMGGSGDNDLEKEDKIITKISNVTTIDKMTESCK